LFRIWLGAALLLVLTNKVLSLGTPFQYPHAWISAHFAVSARSFANAGVLALRGVPVVNNPPYGNPREGYIHWPPLFPIMLGYAYRCFGDSEITSHAFMLAVLLLNASLVWLLVKRCLGRIAAPVAAAAWLASPVTVAYGHLVWNHHLGLAFGLLSLLSFLNWGPGRSGWASIGCVSIGLAALTSWEFTLLCPGLLLISLLAHDRGRARLSALYLITCAVAVALLLTDYLLAYPQQLTELVQILKFRLGLSNQYPSILALGAHGVFERPSAAHLVRTYAVRHVHWLGVIPLAAIIWALAASSERLRKRADLDGVYIFAALVSMWWIWFTAFWFHVFIHDCQMALAAPAAALALGWATSAYLSGQRPGPAHPTLRLLLVALVAVILLIPSVKALRAGLSPTGFETGGLVQFGRDLEEFTSQNSVVLTPIRNEVPLYYSRRHLIREAPGLGSIEPLRAIALKRFPGSPVYFGCLPTPLAKAEAAASKYPVARETPHLLLVDLRAPQ
jgi:hypothetical protein